MSKGIVQNNPANDPDKKPFKSRSLFKPNVSVYQTALFGRYTPFFGAEVVPDDQGFSVRCNSDVDTLTLKSPFMNALRMNKDYFFVPLRAILPNSADLLVTNPLTGDDVNAQLVNCGASVYDFSRMCGRRSSTAHGPLATNFRSVSVVATPSNEDVAKFLFYGFSWYRYTWYYLSEGSLLRNFGYNIHQLFLGPRTSVNNERLTFDEFVENYFSHIITCFDRFSVVLATGVDNTVPSAPVITTSVLHVFPGQVPQDDLNQNISLRQFIFLLQEGYVPIDFYNIYYKAGKSAADVLPFNPWSPLGLPASTYNDWEICPVSGRNSTNFYQNMTFINLSRLVAYQLSCAQFYTADSVDFVYSCDLWHKNQQSLYRLGVGSANPSYIYNFSTFSYAYNGSYIDFDSCSRHHLNYLGAADSYLTNIASDNTHCGVSSYLFSDSSFQYFTSLFFFGNLFGFNRSLKFRDYFVGSKVTPLAVGNVDVTVSGGSFSVVDVTKNIMRQRFLNQVNRIGRTIKEYSRGIFGSTPMTDPHECVWLGSTTDIIGAEETQNTGSAQVSQAQSVTSKLRTESSKFAFEGNFAEFGVVIGILSFDCPRPYVNSLDHTLLHVDRYDMFNPYMQTIGDQAVSGLELDLRQASSNFGYQLRYMEYRQRVDYCAGGFHKFLPGFAFIADYRNISQPGSYDIVLTPDFIRSRSYEFDDLYLMLPNYSPAGYFHFIIRHDLEVSASRPMLSAPSIL